MGKSMMGMTTKQITKAMEEGLAARGYPGTARYVGEEIHISFEVNGKFDMELTFGADVTPAEAVLSSVRTLDKLNGK